MDFSGKFFKYAHLFRMYLSRYTRTPYYYLVTRVRGVRLGRHCTFYGKMIFYRKPDSVIQIGDRCGFRSASWANMVGIDRSCTVATHYSGAKIIIGNQCGFSGTVIGAKESITLGNNVLCGGNTFITDFDWHCVDPDKRRTGDPPSKPVAIEDNVWLGANVMVLKGVTIGKNSVIGANSVVVKSIPPNVVAGGNPAVVIKQLGV